MALQNLGDPGRKQGEPVFASLAFANHDLAALEVEIPQAGAGLGGARGSGCYFK
jgi:hypothetical protein